MKLSQGEAFQGEAFQGEAFQGEAFQGEASPDPWIILKDMLKLRVAKGVNKP